MSTTAPLLYRPQRASLEAAAAIALQAASAVRTEIKRGRRGLPQGDAWMCRLMHHPARSVRYLLHRF